jgi:hypothetical protein
MIIDDPDNYWVWIRPSKPQRPKAEGIDIKEYLQHFGKWLIFSRNRAYLEELARKLDRYVEEGRIHSVKYNKEPAPFAKGALVMCVYCDDRVREDVWKILQSLGVTRRIWKYERQTFEDWLPGGRLYKKAKEVEKISGKKRAKSSDHSRG